MKNIKYLSWLIWLILVVIWNYQYPEASPLLDVIAAILLSILNLVIIRVLKK